MAWTSLSRTQGPAIRNIASPPTSTLPILKATYDFYHRDTENTEKYECFSPRLCASAVKEFFQPLPVGQFLRTMELLQLRRELLGAAFTATLIRALNKRRQHRTRLKRLHLQPRIQLSS